MSLAAQDRSALSALLARTADNSAFYRAILAADGVCEITEPAGLRVDPHYRLVRVDHRLGTAKNEFEIALVDDFQSSVAYYDKVTLGLDLRVSSQYLAQNHVWRSASKRHSLALHNITQKVLFSYIVHSYDILLAADTMTDGGNFYWHRQVSRALEKGLYVYVYDTTMQVLRLIQTQSALNQLQNQAWSAGNQEALRAIISTSTRASFLHRSFADV